MKFNACMDRRSLCAALTVSLLLATGAASAGVVCDTTPSPPFPSTAIGTGAMACGEMNDASGDTSSAVGLANTASGNGSSAFDGIHYFAEHIRKCSICNESASGTWQTGRGCYIP